MIGLSRIHGTTLSGNAHLVQSIGDILSTPLGSRVMRRDYGSMLFDLIDAPLNAATKALVNAAVALALRIWEPRLRITRVTFSGEFALGNLMIDIEGERTDVPGPNTRVALSIPIRRGGAATSAT